MLLLVVEAENDQVRGKVVDRAQQRIVDRAAPGPNLVERRPRDHPAARARMPLALALIIGIEEIGVAVVVEAIARQMIAQHEGLEEPGGVGEMPFGWRDVGHGLDRGIRVRQRRGDGEAQGADRGVARGEAVAGFCPGLCRHSCLPRRR